jgi:hypothetical protein
MEIAAPPPSTLSLCSLNYASGEDCESNAEALAPQGKVSRLGLEPRTLCLKVSLTLTENLSNDEGFSCPIKGCGDFRVPPFSAISGDFR